MSTATSLDTTAPPAAVELFGTVFDPETDPIGHELAVRHLKAHALDTEPEDAP